MITKPTLIVIGIALLLAGGASIVLRYGDPLDRLIAIGVGALLFERAGSR